MISETEKKLFQCLIQRPAIASKNEFIYKAGHTGYDFFDLSRLTLSPKTSGKVVEMYVELLTQLQEELLKEDKGLKITKLAFIETTTGPMTIASQISQRTSLESVVIKSRVPCSCNLCTRLRVKGSIEPPLSTKDKVVIVTNVITTGRTVLNPIKIIEKNGAKVVGAVAILDRKMPDDKSVKNKIKKKKIKLLAVTTRDKLLALGFARPTDQDFKEKNFLKIASEELSMTTLEKEKLENLIFLEAAYILDIDEETIRNFPEDNLLELKNRMISRIFRIRTTTPLITEVFAEKGFIGENNG